MPGVVREVSLLNLPNLMESILEAVLCDDLTVPVAAFLDNALLGLEIDVNDTKTLGVAKAPLEVVHQGPHEVAVQRHATLDGVVSGLEMFFQVGQTPIVVDVPLFADLVGEGGAVLGDVDAWDLVFEMKPVQHPGQ